MALLIDEGTCVCTLIDNVNKCLEGIQLSNSLHNCTSCFELSTNISTSVAINRRISQRLCHQDGWSALISAVRDGRSSLVDALVRQGADVSLQDKVQRNTNIQYQVRDIYCETN